MLEEKAGPDHDAEFTASSGWLKRFKNRYSLHNVNLSSKFLSADVKAEEFLETLNKLVVEENYLPKQILSNGQSIPVLEVDTWKGFYS